MAEEGEVFRKGNKLLGPEEMEGYFAGDELLIEVCHFLLSICNFSEHTSVQLLEAEVELKAYWDRTRDAPSRPYVDNIQDFPLHPAFEVRSLSNLSRFLHFSAPLAHILALFSSPQFIFVICPYSNRSLPPYLLPARVSKLDSLHNSC